jgi:adenylate cyclase
MGTPNSYGIVFADIVGSTRLYELLGNERALAVVNCCIDAMAAGVTAHGGAVVKTIGDEIMAVFKTPWEAFSAAIDMRRRIAALPAVEGTDRQVRARVRIGLHYGPALYEKNDYFGDAVNVAARMAELASAGQILTTGDLLDLLPPNLRSLATEFAEIEVKGRIEPVRAARVADDVATQENTRVSFVKAAPSAPTAALTLRHGLRVWTPPEGTRRILFGREDGCDVVLRGSLASRQHATIEVRRDKVILIDHSSNGTCLILGTDRPIRLRREEFGLINTGRIIFGTLEAEDADVLDFTVG